MLHSETQGESNSLLLTEATELIKSLMEKYQESSPKNPDEINVSIYVNIVDHKTSQNCEMQFGDMGLITMNILDNEVLSELILLKIFKDATR